MLPDQKIPLRVTVVKGILRSAYGSIRLALNSPETTSDCCIIFAAVTKAFSSEVWTVHSRELTGAASVCLHDAIKSALRLRY